MSGRTKVKKLLFFAIGCLLFMDMLGSNHKLRNTQFTNFKSTKDHCKVYSNYKCTQCEDGYKLKDNKCKVVEQRK